MVPATTWLILVYIGFGNSGEMLVMMALAIAILRMEVLVIAMLVMEVLVIALLVMEILVIAMLKCW